MSGGAMGVVLIRCILTALTLQVALALSAVTPAQADRRVAMLIGNSDYRFAETLKNPGNDAQSLASAFRRLGFDKVIEHKDLDARQFRDALQAFEVEAANSDIAVLFFAGHAIEVGGTNFVLPVDAKLASFDDAKREGIRLEQMTHHVAKAKKLRLIILDACRNNPFRTALLAKPGRGEQIGRGLAKVEPGDNVLVAYAAREGTLSEDGDDGAPNSPYTSALLKHLETPNLEVSYIFRLVRDEVLETTGRRQQPHVYGSLGREEFFLQRKPVAEQQGGSRLGRSSLDIERFARMWNSLRHSRDFKLLQAFRDEVDGTEFGNRARQRLDAIMALEQSAWAVAENKRTILGYTDFLKEWEFGPSSDMARNKLDELRGIEKQWQVLQGTEDQSLLEHFAREFGWSEFGAAATSRLVALRRESASAKVDATKSLKARELIDLIRNGTMRFTEGDGSEITFSEKAMPNYRQRLGVGFLKKFLTAAGVKSAVFYEGHFQASFNSNGGVRKIEGLAAIYDVPSSDKAGQEPVGSFILFQMHPTDRTEQDFARNRLTLVGHVIRDTHGYVCNVGNKGWSYLDAASNKKTSLRCELRASEVR
jgi:hypothetical protein